MGNMVKENLAQGLAEAVGRSSISISLEGWPATVAIASISILGIYAIKSFVTSA